MPAQRAVPWAPFSHILGAHVHSTGLLAFLILTANRREGRLYRHLRRSLIARSKRSGTEYSRSHPQAIFGGRLQLYPPEAGG